MDEVVNVICNGATTFTPDMLVRLFLYVCLIYMIGCVASALFNGGDL